jgi:hypothetical protein
MSYNKSTTLIRGILKNYRAFALRSPEPEDTLSFYWGQAQTLIVSVGNQLLLQENNERCTYAIETNQQAINPLDPELVHDTQQAIIRGPC